jgi:hypothetical protein
MVEKRASLRVGNAQVLCLVPVLIIVHIRLQSQYLVLPFPDLMLMV